MKIFLFGFACYIVGATAATCNFWGHPFIEGLISGFIAMLVALRMEDRYLGQ